MAPHSKSANTRLCCLPTRHEMRPAWMVAQHVDTNIQYTSVGIERGGRKCSFRYQQHWSSSPFACGSVQSARRQIRIPRLAVTQLPSEQRVTQPPTLQSALAGIDIWHSGPTLGAWTNGRGLRLMPGIVVSVPTAEFTADISPGSRQA